MKRIRITLLIVLLFALLIGVLISCNKVKVAENVTPEGLELIMTWNLNTVYKVYDREEGNVCYIYIGYEKGGISCLKVKE